MNKSKITVQAFLLIKFLLHSATYWQFQRRTTCKTDASCYSVTLSKEKKCASIAYDVAICIAHRLRKTAQNITSQSPNAVHFSLYPLIQQAILSSTKLSSACCPDILCAIKFCWSLHSWNWSQKLILLKVKLLYIGSAVTHVSSNYFLFLWLLSLLLQSSVCLYITINNHDVNSDSISLY